MPFLPVWTFHQYPASQISRQSWSFKRHISEDRAIADSYRVSFDSEKSQRHNTQLVTQTLFPRNNKINHFFCILCFYFKATVKCMVYIQHTMIRTSLLDVRSLAIILRTDASLVLADSASCFLREASVWKLFTSWK